MAALGGLGIRVTTHTDGVFALFSTIERTMPVTVDPFDAYTLVTGVSSSTRRSQCMPPCSRSGSLRPVAAAVIVLAPRAKARSRQGRGRARQTEDPIAEATGRLIFLSAELSYFLFSFFVEVVSLTAIQFRAERRTILTRRSERRPHFRLTRGSS